MIEKIIVDITEIILIVAVLSGVAIIFAATWYDVRTIKNMARLRALTSNLPKTQQPFVTILIYTHDNASTISECLNGIAANDYKRHKIIVADNASSDRTLQEVATYKRLHPTSHIMVRTRKQPTNRLTALREAYKATRKNELLLILNGTDDVGATVLKEVAGHFLLNRRLSLLSLRISTKFDHRFYTLPVQFIQLTKNIVFKALSVRGMFKNNSYSSPVMVRSTIFTSKLTKTPMSDYVSSIVVTTSNNTQTDGQTSAIKNILTIIITLLPVLIMSYLFYTAATLQSNIMLSLSWLLTVLWLIVVIWSDEAMAFKNKLELLITTPFMYFILYVALIGSLCKVIWRATTTIPSPQFHVRNLRNALQIELYSTRY